MSTTGKVIEATESVVGIFAGVSFFPAKNIFLEMGAGSDFFNGNTYIAIKRGAGIYFSRKHKVFAGLSLINIFQHDDYNNQQFGYLNFTLGIKLF